MILPILHLLQQMWHHGLAVTPSPFTIPVLTLDTTGIDSPFTLTDFNSTTIDAAYTPTISLTLTAQEKILSYLCIA